MGVDRPKNVDYNPNFFMSTLTCIETHIDQEQNHYGSFLIEPLETGQGITLGNAIRRTLLSDLTSFSITGVRINDLKHEFSVIEGLREDVLEVLLNLKEIVFKRFYSSSDEESTTKLKAFLNVKGPVIVTAGMFKLPKHTLKIINPSQYICTLVSDTEFYLEVDIEKGKGYTLTEETRRKNIQEKFIVAKPSTLLVDAIFMPVRKVNYKIKLIHDTQGNIKESLNLEITTNGSITPKRSLQEAMKVLMNLFYPLFVTARFLTISTQVKKKGIKNIKSQRKK
jgi:DNA-directed RNA polymerase subunit alpha